MLKDKLIDMAELTVDKPEYHEFFLSYPMIIDLSHIQSDKEREDIYNIILYKMKHTNRKAYFLYKTFLLPLTYMVEEYDNSGLVEYFDKMRASISRDIHGTATTALKCIMDSNVGGRYLYNHIIYLENLQIAPERMGSHKVKTINLNKILNSSNRDAVEQWVLHLINNTDLSIYTICHKFWFVINSLNQNEKSCIYWTDDDMRTCFDNILAKNTNPNLKSNTISAVTDFFEYLVDVGIALSSSAWLMASEIKIRTDPQYKKTAPSEYILSQIFNALKNADDFIKLSFLILYCTGMRISELQVIKRNCLDIRENATFIKYYQLKMRKEVSNVIPPALAKMIQDYISNNPIQSEYLFCNRLGKRYQTNTFRQKLIAFFEKQNVKNEDGTLYHFLPHSFRHLMAVRMRQFKISFRYIQEQLHHNTPKMTLFYIEHFDNERIKKMSDWINSKGQKITSEDLKLNIRQAQIETAILPNGLCTRPAALPACQHCNTCLGCSYFTTSKDWLPALTRQKERLEGFIESAKNNCWEKAVVNSQRTLDQLNNIINRLEEI